MKTHEREQEEIEIGRAIERRQRGAAAASAAPVTIDVMVNRRELQ